MARLPWDQLHVAQIHNGNEAASAARLSMTRGLQSSTGIDHGETGAGMLRIGTSSWLEKVRTSLAGVGKAERGVYSLGITGLQMERDKMEMDSALKRKVDRLVKSIHRSRGLTAN